jgi:adenylate cyclase
MRARQRRLRFILLGSVAALAIAIPAVLGEIGTLNRVELASVDARLSIRGEQAPHPDVVVVGIDERTVSAYGPPGAGGVLPRSVHAKVIERLQEAGASVIAYDLRFQGRTIPREDNALIEAVTDAQPVVLASFDPKGKPIPVPAGVDPEKTGAILASIGVPTDSDGQLRQMLHSPIQLRTLPVEAAELHLRDAIDEAGFDGDHAWVDFAGPPGTYPQISLADLVRGDVRDEELAGKIVIVGPTDPAAKDLVQTPTSDRPMPGPEFQANSTATVLDDFPLRFAPDGADFLLLVALALVGPVAALRRSSLLVLVAGLAALAIFLVLAQLLYQAGMVIEVAEPVLGLLIGVAGALIAHYAIYTRERRHLRNLFTRFVPPDVVNEVVERVDDDLRLGAVRREGTVMFSDLRGFTSFSETREPEFVVQVVNRYLGEMTDAILAHGGTLVSFMGDGIMALFGAPIEQPDHADRALAAAREMLDVRLPRFNSWLREQGIDRDFRMGIGLNSGAVMSGNVGSEQRLEYTALGDTTNTAARLEGMTKGTAHQLFVANSTAELLRDRPADLTEVGEFEVRGREQKLRVWSLGDGDG